MSTISNEKIEISGNTSVLIALLGEISNELRNIHIELKNIRTVMEK